LAKHLSGGNVACDDRVFERERDLVRLGGVRIALLTRYV
jgi:hypothetical protein